MAKIELWPAPNEVIKTRADKAFQEKRLKTKDHIVLSFFWGNAGHNFSLKEVKEVFEKWSELGISPNSIPQALKRLQDAHLLEAVSHNRWTIVYE